MNKILMASAALAALLAPAESRAGTFYGLWWDGSAEQFVSVDPYAGTKTVIQSIPGVKYITTNRAFDPDSSRYAFVGSEGVGNAQYYYVINAPTGDLAARILKNDTIRSMVYSPNERKAYGLSWTSGYSGIGGDSATNPADAFQKGKQYFSTLDVNTGARTNTLVPGAKGVRLNSEVLNPDSGRYIFSGMDSLQNSHYYVIETATGNLLARYPEIKKIDNAVYDPNTGAIHGLWWSDSSYVLSIDSAAGDSLLPGSPPPGETILAGAEYFITLHPDSSVTIREIPGVKFISFTHAFDSDSGRYVFWASGDTNSASTTRFYVIDVATGDLISQTPFDVRIDNLVYAPDHSTLDPHFGPTHVAARSLNANATRVKSFEGFLTLEAANTEGKTLSFSILDLSGKTLLRRDGIQGSARIDTRGLKNGVHLYQVKSGAEVLGHGKILIR